MFDLFYTNEELSEQMDGTESEINIRYHTLEEHDSDYAKLFLEQPTDELKTLSTSASNFAGRPVEVQIYDLPIKHKVALLNKDNISKLVEVSGVVILRTSKVVRPIIINYICPVCGCDNPIEQDEQWRISPDICCGKSCDNRKGFKKDYSGSTFDDYQWIEIQETVDDTDNGRSPAKVKILLRNHRVDSCIPGETITVTGIYKSSEKSPNTLTLEMSTYIDAVTIINDTEDASIILTDDDILEIKQYIADPEYLNNIRQSIAPSLYGSEHVKEALAYQLCEGQVRHFGKERRRGQFHILLAGSPGCGKSVLGDFMYQCHPKGRTAMGRGASGVGLTASVVKEGETFVLKAGAMPLADNGFLFIDELEKMNQTDSGAMHPGMEQQKIKIDKADISAELNTRCSILATCNPIGGSWAMNKTTKDNLHEQNRGLPLPLLDRFAMTFVFQMNTDRDNERAVIKHIMMVNTNPEQMTPPYSIETLRKIFAYARSITVTTTKEVTEKLLEFYMILFDASILDDSLILSRRQPNDLLRIAEASARLHGRTETIIEDAEAAMNIVARSLEESGIDPTTGKINQSVAFYGQKRSTQGMLNDLPSIIRKLKRDNMDEEHVPDKRVVDYMVRMFKTTEEEANKLLLIGKRDGMLYCPKPGYVDAS